MSQAKVWNDNTLPFVQKWKGSIVEIPAKDYIEMEYMEAVAFKSYPFPMKKDGMGQQLPESYKMIRVEGSYQPLDALPTYKSMVDGSIHMTKEGLEAHDKQFSHLSVKEAVPQTAELEGSQSTAKKTGRFFKREE